MDELTDADAAYLAEISADLVEALGPGARLIVVRRERVDEGVRLVAWYRLGERDHTSAGIGETMLAAHSQLRGRILFDRIRLGLAALISPRST